MADDEPPIDEPEDLAKPDELLALHGVTTELFELLRRWFAVPDEVTSTSPRSTRPCGRWATR